MLFYVYYLFFVALNFDLNFIYLKFFLNIIDR